MAISLADYITAVAGIGTAAVALVDSSKTVRGGISNCGFWHIRRVVTNLFPNDPAGADATSPLELADVLAALRANWLNGTPLTDQIKLARSLIALRLDAITAPHLALITGVDPTILTTGADKMRIGEPLDKQETAVVARCNLMVAALLDEGYLCADQTYRNASKVTAGALAMLLATIGGWTLSTSAYWGTSDMGIALLAGVFATPLAPVAKDLSKAVTAAARIRAQVAKTG